MFYGILRYAQSEISIKKFGELKTLSNIALLSNVILAVFSQFRLKVTVRKNPETSTYYFKHYQVF
jgi:hypothetical protein